MAKTATKTKKRISITNAATLLIITALSAQVLGFLRTKLVNANFPAYGPGSTDSYFAAFNIPDFFFFTLAAGALGVAFMPVLAERLQKGDKKGMWELSSSLMNLLAIIMALVGVVIFVFARPLIHHVVAPNLTVAQLNHAATIMRYLAFNPLLFTISGILAATQQTLGRFVFYALGPIIYNASIILSIFVFRHNVGLVGLGLGALVGAVLQLMILSLGLIGTNFHWQPKILWHSSDFRTILRQLPPRSLDQGVDQIETIVETNFARRLGEGYVTYYNNAYILSTAPALLIGTAISTAAFPVLNRRLAQGRPDLFRSDFLRILRVMIWIATPVTIIIFFTRAYLARMIYSQAAPQISLILGFLTVFIFFTTLYAIISRWFYARKDTVTPLIVSVITIALDIILVWFLARPSRYGVAGLAIAQSLVATMEVIILGVIMLVRDPKLFNRKFWSGVGKIIAVAGFSVVTGGIMVALLPLKLHDRGFFVLGGKFTLIAITTILVHLLLSALFGLEEVNPIFDRLRKILFKPVRVDY
ncbi:MAG: murein biosynthesis integral membrane protein MurJ [Candidatus Saccharimonadales bacterium]